MELKPGYKQTEVGVIPEDWEVAPLVELAHIQTGIAKNSNRAPNNPVQVHYLRVANVQDGFLKLADMAKLTISQEDVERYSVLPGDVLMNEGGDLDKLGRGTLWTGEFSPCIHQNHVFVVRCGQSLFPQFLNSWTSSTESRRYLLLAGKQTTNLASINKTALGLLPVPLPHVVEQRAIATALSDVDDLLAKLDQLLAKKRDIKQAAMQELLTGKRRLPGFIGEWARISLKDTCSMKSGECITNSSIDTHSAYPCYGGNGLRGYTSRYTHDGAYAIIGRQGALCGNVRLVEGKFFASEHAVVVTVLPDTHIQWLAITLSAMNLNQYTESSAQPGLSVSKILQTSLSLPSYTEQAAIAAVLSDMDAEIAELEARREKTRALKQGMMQELLTGRIRLVPPAHAPIHPRDHAGENA